MILKRLILFVGLIFTVLACNKLEGPEKPKNLISKDKMVDILIDAKLISSANSKNKIIMRDGGLEFKTYVYEKHNIDSLQFALSNDYYAFHIKEYEEIYTRLADSLLALKEQLKEIEAEEWKEETKREADSLEKILKEEKLKMDSTEIDLIVNKDSIQLDDALLKESIKEIEGLLEPISDTDSQ